MISLTGGVVQSYLADSCVMQNARNIKDQFSLVDEIKMFLPLEGQLLQNVNSDNPEETLSMQDDGGSPPIIWLESNEGFDDVEETILRITLANVPNSPD